MAKKQSSSEVEYLRSLVRELKSEVRHLKKIVGADKKKIKGYDQFVSDELEVTEEVFNLPKPRCPDCNEILDVIKLSIKEIHICLSDSCNYRKTFNKRK